MSISDNISQSNYDIDDFNQASNKAKLVSDLALADHDTDLVQALQTYLQPLAPHSITLGFVQNAYNEKESFGIAAQLVDGIQPSLPNAMKYIPCDDTLAAAISNLPPQPIFFREDTLSSSTNLLDPFFASFGVRYGVFLPILDEHRCIGLMLIGWNMPDAITNKAPQFYEALGQTSNALIVKHHHIALQNIALRNAERRAQDLQVLAKVSAAVAKVLDVTDLLQTICDMTTENFALYHASVYLIDETRQSLVLAANAGQSGGQMKPKVYKVSLTKQYSFVSLAAQTLKPVVIDDVTRTPNYLPNPFLPAVRSELVAIMISSGSWLSNRKAWHVSIPMMFC